ncbi:dicarboxylate/amino acid:cation symporter [Frateuria edaphi]|jgi:proton glutamate symport protein|uniref:dicarboxylate/amino acid:cation symporter n=1 Tax=Frateuria edaphi TaxID=2898793 RepID=UPI001E2D2547|nr:cation:dicarboxylase symporter family transporter [Frateuria edaphi]UGB45964.1 dicarboxylate/amino acid:cation symporter [Frateuria edaphi]
MSPTARVLSGLAAGAILGLVLAAWNPLVATQVADVVYPVGKLWLNGLQMTVVPLVLALVVVGVNTATDAAASGRIARRAIVVFILLLLLGALFTAAAAPALFSLFPHNPALRDALDHAVVGSAAQAAPVSWSAALIAMIPSNAIMAAAQSAMLPLVVFALFLGFALTRIAPARRAMLVEFFQAIADAMIVIVRWVLWVAPLGVFALILGVCARSGLGMLSALGVYVLAEIVLYLAVTAMMYVVAVVWGGEKLRRFASALLPPQAVAISTQSSLASLPAMLESAEQRLGYPKQVNALVLPMAVTLCRLTSPVQYLTSAAFIAWAYGVDLSAAQLIAGALLAVVISLGSVGLPGAVTFIATNLPVAQSMGLPLGPLGLMLAVDTLPDAFATLGNVTADVTATSVVARQSRDAAPAQPDAGQA